MAKRANPKTMETTHVVLGIDEQLRKRAKAARAKNGVCMRELLDCASGDSLAAITTAVKKLGFGFSDEAKRPARLPLSDNAMAAYRLAARQTGLPMAMLIRASLSLACGGKRGGK